MIWPSLERVRVLLFFFLNTAVTFLELSFTLQRTRNSPLLTLCLLALLPVLPTQLLTALELPGDPVVAHLTPTSQISWSTQGSKKTSQQEVEVQGLNEKATVLVSLTGENIYNPFLICDTHFLRVSLQSSLVLVRFFSPLSVYKGFSLVCLLFGDCSG